MIEFITLAMAVAAAFAIGYVCGRRSDEEQTAHRLLLRARHERIKQLEAEVEIWKRAAEGTLAQFQQSNEKINSIIKRRGNWLS